jgi:hypothetical protein
LAACSRACSARIAATSTPRRVATARGKRDFGGRERGEVGVDGVGGVAFGSRERWRMRVVVWGVIRLPGPSIETFFEFLEGVHGLLIGSFCLGEASKEPAVIGLLTGDVSLFVFVGEVRVSLSNNREYPVSD